MFVKHRAGWTRHVYAHHPFDVVGWDGCLYPWAFSIHDFEPITGRVHQPPPVHQTFEGPNFVICSFVPRKVDYHPLAIPVPYNHHNVDSDEMMFYTGGNYEARRGSGIEQGSISLHPSGFTHGPQPGAVERPIGAEAFDELAVMVDTFRPLDLCDAGPVRGGHRLRLDLEPGLSPPGPAATRSGAEPVLDEFGAEQERSRPAAARCGGSADAEGLAVDGEVSGVFRSKLPLRSGRRAGRCRRG